MSVQKQKRQRSGGDTTATSAPTDSHFLVLPSTAESSWSRTALLSANFHSTFPSTPQWFLILIGLNQRIHRTEQNHSLALNLKPGDNEGCQVVGHRLINGVLLHRGSGVECW